jgi:hypothetical protein
LIRSAFYFLYPIEDLHHFVYFRFQVESLFVFLYALISLLAFYEWYDFEVGIFGGDAFHLRVVFEQDLVPKTGVFGCFGLACPGVDVLLHLNSNVMRLAYTNE